MSATPIAPTQYLQFSRTEGRSKHRRALLALAGTENLPNWVGSDSKGLFVYFGPEFRSGSAHRRATYNLRGGGGVHGTGVFVQPEHPGMGWGDTGPDGAALLFQIGEQLATVEVWVFPGLRAHAQHLYSRWLEGDPQLTASLAQLQREAHPLPKCL